MLGTVKPEVAKKQQRISSAPSGAKDTPRTVPELPVPPKPTRRVKASAPRPPEPPQPPKDEPPAASSQDERKEPEAPSQPTEAKVDVEESSQSVSSGDEGGDQEPKEKKAKKTAFDYLAPVPPASPANDDDNEAEDPQSDSEEKRKECKAVLEKMDALVASQEAREKRRADALGEQVSQLRLDVLITLQRLMQMHVQGEDDKLEELIAAQERMHNPDSATSQKSTKCKDDATSPGPVKSDDEDEPSVPQAATSGYQHSMRRKARTGCTSLRPTLAVSTSSALRETGCKPPPKLRRQAIGGRPNGSQDKKEQ